jgi:DNA-binding transcriptional MocR family regulator
MEQVLITHGSQQALDLVARVTLDVDDPVALADPGYIGAIQAMRLSGGRLVALPTDDHGLSVETLEEQIGQGCVRGSSTSSPIFTTPPAPP